MKQRGSSVDAGTLLNRLIHTTPELTDGHYQEMFVPVGPWKKGTAVQRPADVSVGEKKLMGFMIGSTQEETQRLEMIGTLMRQNMKVRESTALVLSSLYDLRKLTSDVVQEFVRSCKPMFVASGYAPALIDRLTEGTDKGINLAHLRVSF